MTREHLKFVVVGSVDHGKSTLIGRFLYDTGSLPDAQFAAIRKLCEGTEERVEFAFVLDHLAEERARHITIDTAQTFFSSDTRDYVIIDAPGHKEFLKNMITGASQASAALLLLDVHEGLREQTRRHAYMLSLLGVKQLIVVLNKMDLVGFEREVFEEKARAMQALLEQVTLEHLVAIPAAALEGDNIVNASPNMPWYSGPTVVEALDLLRADVLDETLPLRLPIQDVYEIDGRKLAVGRVAAGCVARGDTVAVSPAGRTVRIESLEKFEGEIESAAAGESIGFTATGGDGLTRGLMLSAPDALPESTTTLRANVFWMTPDPLRRGEKLALRLTTQELPCTVTRIADRMNSGTLEVLSADADQLMDTEVAEVTLKTDARVYYDSFARIPEMGRLVLMRGGDIVAGGIVP